LRLVDRYYELLYSVIKLLDILKGNIPKPPPNIMNMD